MPLVTCPDCGNRISDSAPACIHCGRPAAAGFAPAPLDPAAVVVAPGPAADVFVPQPGATQPATAAVENRRELRCPACGSGDVRRLSVIHADGLSTVSATGQVTHHDHHRAHDPGHHRHDRDTINTVTTAQTRSSAEAAPPAMKNPWLFGCLGAVCALFAGVILAMIASLPGFLIGAGAAGWYFWRRVADARRWNAEEYPPLRMAWERTFRCDR